MKIRDFQNWLSFSSCGDKLTLNEGGVGTIDSELNQYVSKAYEDGNIELFTSKVENVNEHDPKRGHRTFGIFKTIAVRIDEKVRKSLDHSHFGEIDRKEVRKLNEEDPVCPL